MNYGKGSLLGPPNGSALESILISVSTALDVEMAVLRKYVNELLTLLEEDIDRERLRNMLVYSKKLSAFEKKATLIRDALAEILDNGILSTCMVNRR
jgi:magnesium transporter